MDVSSDIAREKAKLGIFLSALLHFSLALPFIVIALPILHFVKERPPEEESKAPSSLKEPDAMMVDILAFSEEDPESFAPSKFLGVEGTRQTLAFEKEAPESVPRTQLVESLEPLKDAEKEATTEEEGEAEPTSEKAADIEEPAATKEAAAAKTPAEAMRAQEAAAAKTPAEAMRAQEAAAAKTPAEAMRAQEAAAAKTPAEAMRAQEAAAAKTPAEAMRAQEAAAAKTPAEAMRAQEAAAEKAAPPPLPEAAQALDAQEKTGHDETKKEPAAPRETEPTDEKAADTASKETAASAETIPAPPSPSEAVASKPPPTSEEATSAPPLVGTTPEAAPSRPGKSAAAKGRLGELLQGMRELDSRLDQALEEKPEEALNESQVQALIRLQDAAAQGYAHAQHRLATTLMKGASKDFPEEAKKLLTRAAQSGYVESQVLLGYLAASDESKKSDFAEALAWMNLAAEKGNKAASYGAKKLERLMKVEEIIQAHRRTQRYRRFAASAAPAVVGIDDDRPPDEILRDASATGNAELVQLMLARGADPDSVDDSGRSALINAAWRGRKKIIELLLEKGADLSVRDLEGLSAANWAAINGHPDVIRTLGKAGANLDNRDNDNLTPLMRATWNGHLKAVTALLDEGADPTLRTPSGKTALDFAREEGYEPIQKLLQRAEGR